MILTKSPISLHEPAGPTPSSVPVLRFLRRFNPFSPATPFIPPAGPATGSFNGLHPRSNFLAVPTGQRLTVPTHSRSLPSRARAGRVRRFDSTAYVLSLSFST